MGHEFAWVSMFPFFDSLSSILGHEHDAYAAYHAILVVLLLSALVIIFGRKQNDIVPDERVTVRNVLEVTVEAIVKLIDNTMGTEGRKFVPLIGTLAVFILFCNLLGLIPGFLPPTDNINTTAACALTVFFYYHYLGIKKHGWGYVKQFTGPFLPLAPLMFPIEVISHLARPLSLSLRLFGNITGDHLVLSMSYGFALALGLGIFVSFIQSLVFILLSMMYISGAIAEEGH